MPASSINAASFMMNKTLLSAFLALGSAGLLAADPYVPAVGSVWGHPGGMSNPNMAGAAAIFSDPLAHGVGDTITIIVDLSNAITKAQNTKTAKTASVNDTISSLVYPSDGSNHGFSFYNLHGVNPQMTWSANQAFNGGGTVANTEDDSTTIQARVVEVLSNGVLRVAATRLSKAGDEDTRMVLTGLVRPEDLNTDNSISSSRVADLQIVQKGRGALSESQKKGWLTKLYEFLSPF
jgi:flagellar L-ring protein precursor FlgH